LWACGRSWCDLFGRAAPWDSCERGPDVADAVTDLGLMTEDKCRSAVAPGDMTSPG